MIPTTHLRTNGSVFEQLWMASDGSEGEWRALNQVDVGRKRGCAGPATREELDFGPVHYLDKPKEGAWHCGPEFIIIDEAVDDEAEKWFREIMSDEEFDRTVDAMVVSEAEKVTFNIPLALNADEVLAKLIGPPYEMTSEERAIRDRAGCSVEAFDVALDSRFPDSYEEVLTTVNTPEGGTRPVDEADAVLMVRRLIDKFDWNDCHSILCLVKPAIEALEAESEFTSIDESYEADEDWFDTMQGIRKAAVEYNNKVSQALTKSDIEITTEVLSQGMIRIANAKVELKL